MKEIKTEDLTLYFKRISENHKTSTKNTGYEINDRSVFKNEFLKILGYDLNLILDDVSQKVGNLSKTPDIRLYGKNESKTKNSHSQFVIETKNYNLLEHNADNIDFKQLKNYIISNKSKIRLICSTDYVSLFVFNASEIKKEISINKIDNITNQEINIFKKNLLYEIYFDNLKKRDSSDLKNLCYDSVFAEHKFITPTDYEDIYSVKDTNNRNNFIANLFQIMKTIEKDVELDFYDIQKLFHDELNKLIDDDNFKKQLIDEILKEKFKVIKSFLIWGSEMNYIVNVITDPNSKIKKSEAFSFFDNKEYQEAFILTSVYNLINKTFFIRILEDSSTDSTTFLKGVTNNRYLSNGILQEKIKENEETLIQYLKDVYEFSKPDLKQFSFLLRKDIYSWILECIDSHNLISFIRMFNDISFKKLNQDILGDIYEHYLEQDKTEDSKSFRRLLGQYYTPKPIVRLMWFLVRDVLKKTKNRDLYKKNESYLDILDPAYGSGTFLYEAILQVNQSAVDKSITKDGKVWGFIKERNNKLKFEDHLFGFEINPLSKSIADINLYFGLIQAYGTNNNNLNNFPVHHLNIYRTNSLELDVNTTVSEHSSLFPFMADDLRYSLEDKEEILDSKKRKYDIIIGNPPYGRTTTQRDEKSKNSEFFYIEADKLKHLQNNIIPFAYPENNFNAKGELIEFTWENKQLKGSVPSFEKNRGKIQDMFGFFFGISDHLIKKDGIVCYIVSNTILGVPSYKWFRKYLLENYKFHYIINFNRIQEDGNSMFAPEAKVATCIIIMQKEKPDNHFEVNYLDLGGIESTIEKFNSIANCRWSENPKNKNDIVDFEVKNLKDLNFKKVKQTDFLKNPDYELLIFEKIINKMVRNSKILSSYGHYKCGVSSSKDDVFFAPSKEDLINNVSTFLKEKQINYEVTESNIKELIKHEEIDKFVLNNIYYVYYDIELEKILRKSILKNMRLGNSDSMLSNYKLLIGAHFFYVDDSSRVMNLNCINRKNLYYLTNNDIDVLYYICAIMNSKLSKYYRRITQIDNYEIFPIKDYNLTNITIKNKLIKLSKEIHLFKKDQQSFNKNISDFKSEWFIKNILPKGKNVSVLDGSEFWHLSFTNEMVPDYYVSGAKINEKKENEIILNSESKIVCKDKDIAMQLFENYLKDYDGDLSDKEIVINITAFRDPKEYNKIKQTVETKCNSIEEEIDDLVFTIYEIDDKERIAISNEINET